MIDFEKIKKAIVEAVVDTGIEKYEIYYQSESDMSTETLKDEISSFSSGVSGGICFRCIYNGKMGYASTQLMDENEMRELVNRALNNAKYIESDEEPIIFKGSPSYGKKTVDSVEIPNATAMKEAALQIQRNTYAQGDFVTDGTQSQVMGFETETFIYNSEGLELYNKAGMSACIASVVINENGESESDYDIIQGCDNSKFEELSKNVVASAREKLGAGDVSSGTYDIIIDGRQMRSILSAFFPIFSGKTARLGLSLLAGKIGEKIASDCVTISDDPFDINCCIQTTFDAEGVAVYPKNVVENGVLKTLLYDLKNAKIAGVETTGNASKGGYSSPVGISPYRFRIEPGKYSDNELFEIVNNGIYVTEIKGLHAGANATTGDFSIESAGFVIEKGKKGRAVKSFTIAGNFYELLKNITHIGADVSYGISGGYTVFASPSVIVKNISVAGK